MAKKVDLTGQTFGKLHVLGRGVDYVSPSGQHLKRWSCQCECGKIIDATTSSLKRGMKSCGCIPQREDLTGRRFGRLLVIGFAEDYVSPKGSRMPKWHCKCDCGNELNVLGMSLKNGDCKSCGCLNSSSNKDLNHSVVRKESCIPMDLSGQVFGDLQVLTKVHDKKPVRYECLCSCGKTVVVLQKNLTSGRKTHCGCKTIKVQKVSKRKSPENVIGKVYGELSVIEECEPHITPNGSKQRIVKCRCSCGNELKMRLTAAQKNGKCTECLYKDRRIDVTGKKYGKLRVLSMADDYVSPSGHRLSRCVCICDCGNECIVNMSGLVTGSTRSCGCISNTRGKLIDHPEFLVDYDYEKNKDIDLNTIATTSQIKVYWKCPDCGMSYPAVVSSHTDLKKKHGCPYCSGRLVVKGKTDLLSQKPEIVKEWDYEDNDIAPDEISCHSSQKVFWKCSECGHVWKQTVANRVSGSGCPKCNIENVNSFCEQAVYFYIKQVFPDAINGDNHIGMELDIYIPSISTAIEYDGEAWHRSVKKTKTDYEKNNTCIQNGIRLIRIREPKLPVINGCVSFVRTDSTSNASLDEVITTLLNYLKDDNGITVDTSTDTTTILEQYATKKYKNSLAYCYPEIAKEWHPTKNGLLTPDKVNKASRYVVWWLGKCGHEWDMSVSDRTVTFVRKSGRIKKQYGCPYCSGKRLGKGINDLQTRYPQVAEEWPPTKNGELKPDEVMPGTNKKYWWLGKCGHEWQDSPNGRCSRNRGCPICWSLTRGSNNKKKVTCIETGIVYDSIKEAKAATQISTIGDCCKGRIKTAGGYHWKYVD